MKLSHLRDVLAVAEHGSIRAAARSLGATQPAITRSIRDIEHELGVSLFQRHSAGIKLTDMGQTFIRRAASIQHEVRRAREEIDQLKGGLVGEVTVALSTASIMSLMSPAVAQFRRRYPDVVLKVHETFLQPVQKRLASGEIDFYVGPLEDGRPIPDCSVDQVFQNYRMIVARRGHPLSSARSLHELVGARWVRPTLSPHIVEGDFEEMFLSAGLPRPNIVVHARSALITMLAVMDGDLLSVVPRQWLDQPLLASVIEPLPLSPIPAAPVAIVRRRDMPLTPVAEYLHDMILRAGIHYADRHAGIA